jgi:hypothetical protein
MRMTQRLVSALTKDTNGEAIDAHELKLLNRYKNTPEGWMFSARRHVGKAIDRIDPMELPKLLLSIDADKARSAAVALMVGAIGAQAAGKLGAKDPVGYAYGAGTGLLALELAKAPSIPSEAAGLSMLGALGLIDVTKLNVQSGSLVYSIGAQLLTDLFKFLLRIV